MNFYIMYVGTFRLLFNKIQYEIYFLAYQFLKVPLYCKKIKLA